MADIASLGIRVTTQGVQQAEQQLDKLTKTGARTEAQAGKIAPAMGRTALSARELANATRGLPAQFTDIATALGSGQRPLQVLLQQGGQLKDMFGGIGPAFRAMGSYIVGLINPFTLAAAAAGALALAWKQGQDEAEGFNKALILTGNYAGTTAGQMQVLALEMDNMAGVTAGSAAAALTRVAETGKFTGEQLALVATAAELMRVGTGKAVEDTIAEFLKLRKDPVDAILELNDTYHFLTRAQLDHIRLLEDEGRHQEAVTEAIRIYANVVRQRVPEVVENLNSIGRAWMSIKVIAREVWDELRNIGRANTPETQAAMLIRVEQSRLRSISANINAALKNGRQFSAEVIKGYNDQIARSKKLIADSRRLLDDGKKAAAKPTGVVDTAAERARIAAEEDFARLALSNLDKRQKLEHEIAEIRKLGEKAGKSELEIEKQIAAARARYEESLPKARTKKPGADPADGIAAQIRRQIALNEEELASQDKLTASDRLRITVQQQLIELKDKLTSAGRAEIEVLLAELDASGNAVEAMQEQVKLTEELARLTNQLASAEENRRRGNQIDLLQISGIGQRAVESMQRRLDIEREYTIGLRELRDRGVAEGTESYRRQEAELRASRDRMLADEEAFQRERAKLEADWRNGANAAISDFVAESENVAAQMYDIWSGAIDGLTDVLTDFFTKGTADWRGFLDGIAAEIMRFIIKQQMSKWLKDVSFGGAGSGGGDNFGEAAGSLLSLFSGGSGFGFASGGFTGAGQRNQVKGVVHAGEYVLNADATAALGRGYLDRLNAGQAPAMQAGPMVVTQHFTQVVQGRMDGTTAEQAARANGREARRGMARTG